MKPTNQSAITYGLDKGSPDGDMTALSIKVGATVFTFVGDAAEAIEAYANQRAVEARIEGYDFNRLGSWIFIGDNARLQNLDDLYWSYVMEVVAEHDPYAVSTGNYSLDYIKNNMKYASFGSVGIHKILARADQRAKERIAQLRNQDKDNNNLPKQETSK